MEILSEHIVDRVQWLFYLTSGNSLIREHTLLIVYEACSKKWRIFLLATHFAKICTSLMSYPSIYFEDCSLIAAVRNIVDRLENMMYVISEDCSFQLPNFAFTQVQMTRSAPK